VIAAYIRGVGLSCALGLDATACVDAMLAGRIPSRPLALSGFDEPLTLPYYRIPDGEELFDPGRFARLLPPVVQAAVRQAGLSEPEIRTMPILVGSSCFSVGLAETEYAAALKQSGAAMPMPICDYDYPAGLARAALGCEGETWAFNTACTASANALLAAWRLLRGGRHRHALVLGAELANLTTLAGFYGLQILADAARPFDAERKGIVLGEGIGAMVLSLDPVPGALRILGGASNCDTYSVTTANPDGQSVAAVLRTALDHALLSAQEMRAIRGHGTGTGTGDQAEAAGLQQVFGVVPPVSALKGYLGHTLGACGVNELVLYAGALQRDLLPASPGFMSADPAFKLEPLRSPAAAPAGHYLLNHFGFGGNNTVLVLEKPA
jgi:3-oxoacyl-[acyl-carrier-protein] synthase I